jgi:primosomal replication protein N
VSATERGDNSFHCIATLAERDVLRYTPAGIPMVSATLTHTSEQLEADISRQVGFELRAIAAGTIADRLERAQMGALFRFSGFMARKNRNSKALVFHLTDFELIS